MISKETYIQNYKDFSKRERVTKVCNNGTKAMLFNASLIYLCVLRASLFEK